MVSENNKTIVKNTLLLYFRMILIMAVSLYTVRIVLSALGVVDYGIYNVVGGIVSMFTFLSSSMASASQRFFAFELGKNDSEKLKQTFSLTLLIYFGIALLAIIVAETVGLWFLNNKMIIPEERLSAANWVYQFSIMSFVITILITPYKAVIIARENMKIFASVSIVEVLIKLLVVYLILAFSVDKLKLYGFLILLTTILVSLIYYFYCRKNYKESRFSFYWEQEMFKELVSYSGWNMLGSLANVLKIYGTNILLNMFFGPIVNAARGVAFQVSNVLSLFAANFQLAVRPQITKLYAREEKEQMMSLIFSSTKFLYYLLMVLSLPVLLETELLISIWLKEVPEYTILFTKLLIINILIETINNQLVAALQAAGKIKLYQKVVSSLQLLLLPISYLFYKLGYSAEVTFYILIAITLICYIPQLLIVSRVVGLSIMKYIKDVIFVIIIVTAITYIIPSIILIKMEYGIPRFLYVVLTGFVSSAISIYFLGINGNERILVRNYISKKRDKLRKK